MEITSNPKLENLPKVLLLGPIRVYTLFESEFSSHFQFIKCNDSPLPLPHFLATSNATAMLIGGHIPITACDVLDHLPSLRCIVTITAGLNHIDLAECCRRGIAVTSAGDAYSNDCADFALALLIDLLRKVSSVHRFGQRVSAEGHYCLSHRLKGKKIGIIGLGSIGSRIARRLEAFGCTILYSSRKQKPSVSYPFYSDICELATNSDILVISCALTNQTRHMINKQVLSALGKEGVIINIARGAIIDEKELVRFLVEGKIAGAGLDVFENEPYVPKELSAMDNVVLLPHAAFITHESFRDVFELAKGNLLAFFSNKPLLSPVTDV
ncbi:Glyoxylate/hydroxypyruvate reductase HPR3 [Bienertia sinuspersici]